MENQQLESAQPFRSASANFYALKPNAENFVAKALAALEKTQEGEFKNVGLCSVPTHVLELLGIDWMNVTADKPATIVLHTAPPGSEGVYTPAIIIVNTVDQHWAFGRVMPLDDEYTATVPQYLNKKVHVAAPIDLMTTPESKNPMVVFTPNLDRRKLFLNEQGQERQILEIKGPGAYKLPVKLMLDRATPKNRANHINFLKGLEPRIRGDRRIMREYVESGAFLKDYQAFKEIAGNGHWSHRGYLADLIDCDLEELDKFKELDALSDEEYISAVEKLIEVDAQQTWAQQRRDQQTELEFLDWVQEQTGRPFTELHHNFLALEFPDRFKATVVEGEGDEDDVLPAEPVDIAVTVYGTIVEEPIDDQILGLDVPFAIETLQALQLNGHRITIVTGRNEEETEQIVEALKERGFEADAVNFVMPNNINQGKDLHNLTLAQLSVDMIIDFRCVGMQLQTLANHEAKTLFWPPVTSWLKDNGFITQKDVSQILLSLQNKSPT